MTHLLNMLEIGVGMGLMLSIFAMHCSIFLLFTRMYCAGEEEKKGLMHSALIVIVLIAFICVIVVLFYYRRE